VSRVVLKDKKDMNELFQFEGYENWDEITDNKLEWEDFKIMGSQDEIERDLETEVLSVKFSKIGQKTFNAYPNLKWIQCRAHGSDNINLELAEKRRVGVVCLDPDTFNVAKWIDRWKKGPKVLPNLAERKATTKNLKPRASRQTKKKTNISKFIIPLVIVKSLKGNGVKPARNSVPNHALCAPLLEDN